MICKKKVLEILSKFSPYCGAKYDMCKKIELTVWSTQISKVHFNSIVFQHMNDFLPQGYLKTGNKILRNSHEAPCTVVQVSKIRY